VARGYGYDRIEQVVPDGVVPSPPFETAVDTMLAGDIDGLRAQLSDDPALARRASHWPQGATLLHYAASTGVEIHRQVVPDNLPEIVTLLVDHRSDVDAPAHAYGGEQRPWVCSSAAATLASPASPTRSPPSCAPPAPPDRGRPGHGREAVGLEVRGPGGVSGARS
jgi:hypothetical protein